MGKTVLIASGKGGVGKTTIAVNLGVTAASAGMRVVLVDFNTGLRNLDLYLGLENEVLFDVGDVLSGLCDVEKSLVKDRRCSNLFLLSGAQGKEVLGLTEGHLRTLFRCLRQDFDLIIADGPTGISEYVRLAGADFDRAVIVATPDHSAIRNGDMVDRQLQSMGIQDRCHIVNMVHPELYEEDAIPKLQSIADGFQTPMIGIVPHDYNVHIANNRGLPVTYAPEAYIAENFRRISRRLFEC